MSRNYWINKHFYNNWKTQMETLRSEYWKNNNWVYCDRPGKLLFEEEVDCYEMIDIRSNMNRMK